MQNYTPMRLAPSLDEGLRNDLLKVDRFLRQLTPFAARVPTFPQGSTAAAVDLSQFLYLPGRVPNQRAYGTVVFRAKTSPEAGVLDDSVYRGLTLEGNLGTSGGQTVSHIVYFQPDNAAGTNIVRKWIFPSLTGSATDTFTFVTVEGSQTLTNKVLQSSTITVGLAPASGECKFVFAEGGPREFYIGFCSGYPTTATASPSLRLPPLDTASDEHTFAMVHINSATPFPAGSILYGNSAGTELLGLTNGTIGQPFVSGGTTAAPAWSWHFGSGTRPTSGADDDISTYGRLYVGTTVSEADAFLTQTQFSLKRDVDATTAGTTDRVFRQILNITGTGAVAASASITAHTLSITGGASLTSGTLTLSGFRVDATPEIPSGVTGSISGLTFNAQPSGTGTFTITGGSFGVGGSSGGTATNILGLVITASNNSTVTTNLVGVRVQSLGGFTAAVTQATAFDVTGGFANDTDVVTWSGLRIAGGITAAIANKWSLDLTNTSTNMGSRISHKMGLGWTPATVAAITSRVMLAAGTTAASTSPLKFQSGTSMTAAEAGAVEFTTDDLFFTITTGAARKAFVLTDGTNLTATRVPFATTNGRLTDVTGFSFASSILTVPNLIDSGLTSGRVTFATTSGQLTDDADMTFATDTLTVTKIVASTSLAVAAGAAITELERTASGTYTPTLTNVTNVSASTAFQAQYMRVGNTVTVSSKVEVDPTAAGLVQLGISLPIASNLGAEEECCGTACAPGIAGQSAAILGDTGNDRAEMEWIAVDVTNQRMAYTFTYKIT